MLHTQPLRKQRDYRLLWSARTISVTGSEVSRLAVPLTAIALLTASPFQMGLLTAASSIPALLLSLQAGAISDRLRRHRPLMIVCELVSAAAALMVPIAWLLGLLSIPLLIGVALLIGAAGVIFKAANFPHLAAVVPADQRTQAMAGFQASYSVASVAGPGLAGLLVQLLSAPLAVLLEGLSFLASALLLRSIRTPERRTPAPSRGMWRDVKEGLRVSLTRPVLRALLGAGVTINFFAMAYISVHMLYMVNTLDIPKALIGFLVALSGAGGLVGAWVTARLTPRFGENRLLRWSIVLFPLDILTVGLLDGPLWFKLATLSITGCITGGLVVTFATCMGAVMLRDTPAEFRGRVNATSTFAVQGVLALGGLAGGSLAEVIGLRPVILICAAGIALSSIWIWTSPLRANQHPSTPDAPKPTTDDTSQPTPDSSEPISTLSAPKPTTTSTPATLPDTGIEARAIPTSPKTRAATSVSAQHHTHPRPGALPKASSYEIHQRSRRDRSHRSTSAPTYGDTALSRNLDELVLVKIRSFM
ncbi:MFS transporter [Nonomuraea sp. NBC_01738]|uniref:MFS transporter n=1 Tax=Nonomuraea sp. NBC_01738 TaxID=2976003 RepID=UPI002E0FB591|nr:MFS transporter [Nonomuraea sp. NBC_01738]